jgi:hypothetical protein
MARAAARGRRRLPPANLLAGKMLLAALAAALLPSTRAQDICVVTTLCGSCSKCANRLNVHMP